MDGRTELLTYMGAAIATVVALFGLQIWYASYLDTQVVNVYPADTPPNPQRVQRLTQERAKLEAGKMPIARAKSELAQRGRTAFPSIVPKPSDDLSPMAGWMHRPGFAPYVPRTAPPEAAAEPAAPGEAEAQAEAQAAAGAETETAAGAAVQESETALATPARRAPAAGGTTAAPAPRGAEQAEPVVKVPPGSSPTPGVQP